MSFGTMTHSLLVIDVGNTRIKFGIFARSAGQREHLHSLPDCADRWDVALANPDRDRALIARLESLSHPVTAAWVAGANPTGIDELLTDWPTRLCPRPQVLDRRILPLKIRVAAPDAVGIDRLLNAVAGNVLRPTAEPLILVSSGTATTVDLLAADGAFEGGAILPGLDLAGRSLHEYTALLPELQTDDLLDENHAPPRMPGKNTHDAIRNGLYYGQVGAIKELIAPLDAQAGRSLRILLTGGCGPLLVPAFHPRVTLVHDLPLKGLACVAIQSGFAP